MGSVPAAANLSAKSVSRRWLTPRFASTARTADPVDPVCRPDSRRWRSGSSSGPRRRKPALRHSTLLFACETLQERRLGKLGPGPTLTTRGSGRDSSDHPWNQCLGRLSVKPLDLDRQHLDARHLRVEERDHPCKGIRYLVRHEQETETPCLQIRGYALPETLHIRLFILLQQSGKFIVRIKVSIAGLIFECVAQFACRPILRSVRRILQHLPNNAASYLGVGSPLHLRQCGNCILVDDQVVNRPSGALSG